MKNFILILILFVSGFVSGVAGEVEDQFAEANQLYKNDEFKAAAEVYEQIVDNGFKNYEIFYNLGNAYFKLDMIPDAILNYERASKMDPSNEDVNFNLKVASLKIIDKINPIPEVFYVSWFNTVKRSLSESIWAWLVILGVWLLLASFAGFLFLNSTYMKKLTFAVFVVSVVVTVVSFVAGYSMKNEILNAKEAIIFTPSAYVKSSPEDDCKDNFILHEGTKVSIIEEIGEWYRIRIANGSKGWLHSSRIEII
jgi:tetratricopeptide (TPR) repeat protein